MQCHVARPVVVGECTTFVQVDERQRKFRHAENDQITEGSPYVEAFSCRLIPHRNTFARTDRRVREREVVLSRTVELQDRMDNW